MIQYLKLEAKERSYMNQQWDVVHLTRKDVPKQTNRDHRRLFVCVYEHLLSQTIVDFQLGPLFEEQPDRKAHKILEKAKWLLQWSFIL